MRLADEVAFDIYQEVSMGMKCYYNKQTKETVSIPDELHLDFDDEQLEDWREEIDKVESAPEQWVEFEQMPSHEVFRLMERFAEVIADPWFRGKVVDALEHHKPFQNFKGWVEGNEPYRTEWFAFRDAAYTEWIQQQAEGLLREDEDDDDSL
jgi:hypothetical protein